MCHIMGLEVWELIECLRKVVWVAKVVKEISASPFRLDGGSMRINNGLNRGTLKMGVNHHIDKTEMFLNACKYWIISTGIFLELCISMFSI